jgi:hypothetical protein
MKYRSLKRRKKDETTEKILIKGEGRKKKVPVNDKGTDDWMKGEGKRT